MSSSVDRSFIMRHGWQIILALLAIGAAGQKLDQKADRLELKQLEYRVDDVQRQVPGTARTDSLLRQVLTELREVKSEQRAMRTLICRREASDSWCGS